MNKYRMVCLSGCINDVKYSDSSSHIQRIKTITLQKNKLSQRKNILDINATNHAVRRLRSGGASVPKKFSV